MSENLNFLIPIDFQPESETALSYALGIGRDLKATLHLVHILEDESPLYRMVLNDDQRDMIRRGASDKLDELAGKVLGAARIPFTTSVLQGKIYNRITETAERTKADLIFMGRTDSSDIKKNITGTNTMHIIKEARVPVITLRKKPARPGCSHLVLPLDLTKQTVKKASNAIATARMLNARITVISFLPDKRKSIEIKFIQKLDEIRNTIQKLGTNCDIKLVQPSAGDPVKKLNQSVKEFKGDLLMIMTQQELHFNEFFIGSWAQEVINKSDCPVLSITPLAEEKYGIPDPLSQVFINPIQVLDR